jgi:hypothetical protein
MIGEGILACTGRDVAVVGEQNFANDIKVVLEYSVSYGLQVKFK